MKHNEDYIPTGKDKTPQELIANAVSMGIDVDRALDLSNEDPDRLIIMYDQRMVTELRNRLTNLDKSERWEVHYNGEFAYSMLSPGLEIKYAWEIAYKLYPKESHDVDLWPMEKVILVWSKNKTEDEE